ncbi:hypothetical protein ACJJTC_007610 [Scirpophaga incertulas]
MDDPPASIPKIFIKATPEWHLLLKRIKAELGKPTPASCDGTTSQNQEASTCPTDTDNKNYDDTANEATNTDTTEGGASIYSNCANARHQRCRHTAMRDNSSTGASSPMPSEEESSPDASPIRTPTPQMPASREDSPARTPTPTMSASESRDGSPQGAPSPTKYWAESPDTLPSRKSTPQMSENTPRDCSPTITRTPSSTLSTKSSPERFADTLTDTNQK